MKSETIPFVVAGLVTGLLASGYAILFRILSSVSVDFFNHKPLLWSLMVPVGFASSFVIVKKFSPESSGSGIPQVMAALHYEGTHQTSWVNRLLGIKVIVVKVLSSLVCVAAGGAVGREGPSIQIGSSVGYLLSRFFPTTPDQQAKRVRNLILAGGASGIAAAFNTPLGGVVFAIEELSKDSFKQFRSSVLLAVIISGMTALWVLGSYLYLGHPDVMTPGFTAIMASVLVALFAGLLGGMFGDLLFFLVALRKRAQTFQRQLFWILGLSALFIGITFISHGVSIGPGTENINVMIADNQSSTFWVTLVRFFSNQITFVVGGAGGIFSPALSIGAHLGAWMSTLFASTLIQPNLLAIVGMTAFLSGLTHAPLTSAVLVQEMMDRPNLVFPILLGSLIAHFASAAYSKDSFYERMSLNFRPVP